MKSIDELSQSYALIDAQIAELTAKKDAIRDIILNDMVDADEKKVETSFGSFSVTSLKKWTYPQEVLDKKDEFDALKAKAESTGDATYTETPSLRFTKAKL